MVLPFYGRQHLQLLTLYMWWQSVCILCDECRLAMVDDLMNDLHYQKSMVTFRKWFGFDIELYV